MFNQKNKIKNQVIATIVLFQLVIGLALPLIAIQAQDIGMGEGVGLEGGAPAPLPASSVGSVENIPTSPWGKFWSGLKAGLFGKKEEAKKPEEPLEPVRYGPKEIQTSVPTMDPKMLQGQNYVEDSIIKGFQQESARDTAQQEKEKKERNNWRSFGSITATAIKSALRYFLNTLAYESASWLASGGEGQQPVFYTEGWPVYLENLADESMGAFIESIGETAGEELGLEEASGSGWKKFNLCEPPGDLKVSVTLSLAAQRRPAKPKCSLKQALGNWQNFITQKDFLDRFRVNFDSGKNDITASLGLLDYAYTWSAKKQLAKAKDRDEAGLGLQPAKKNPIADFILTPAAYTHAIVSYLPALGKEGQTNFTGDIIADAINTFIGTLAGQLFQKMVKEGMAKLRGDNGNAQAAKDYDKILKGLASDVDLLTGESGQALFGGKQAAQQRFSSFFDADIISQGEYQVLNQLAICTNPNSPASDECVIGNNFRLAVDQGLTVKEALAKGLLDGEAPFGFTSQGFEPPYNEGYPYRSLIILRTYRIIPVTWEIAAQIISRVGKRTYGLNDLIAVYDDKTSPFYGLIDQSWVLKTPQAYCRAEGFGPAIISSQTINGDQLINRDTYCADYQSCIQKDSQGNCIYGYCMEEKRTWDLQASQCPAYYASCQSYTDRRGELAAYLKNSLDYNNCGADNVGCNWYCQAYNTINNLWTCANEGERVFKPCSQVGGCPLTASCEMAEDESFCTDEVNKVDLLVSSACAQSSKWWVAEKEKCLVTASCKIESGGVRCQQGGCDNLANLIPNPGFESRPAQIGELADKWLTPDSDYFSLVSGASEEINGGKNSIRFYSPGGLLGNASTTSGLITLPVGDYTFSGFVYNRLNVGEVKIKVGGNVTQPVSGLAGPVSKVSALRGQWEQLSTDFKVVESAVGSGEGQVEVSFVVFGPQVSGTVWFDDFKISPACIIDQVSLALTGTIEQDQSKIHFDRDAKECSAEADGCSQLIALGPDIGTNLVVNGSFEDWSDTRQPPPGWSKGYNWEQADPAAINSFELITDGSAIGTNSLKLIDKTILQQDFQTANGTPKLNLQPGRTYIVSFYAKSDQENENWYADFIWSTPAFSPPVKPTTLLSYQHLIPVGQSTNPMLPLTTSWQRFVFSPITLDTETDQGNLGSGSGSLYGRDFTFNINNYNLTTTKDARDTIYLDGVQIEEVFSTNQPTDYKDYGAANLVALRKAPTYLACQGYTSSRPSPYVLENVREAECVGEILIWRPDSCQGAFCCHEIDPAQCFAYAMYCQADEVGCQAYTPLSGGPTIPGVVAYDDYCPAECVGYNAFKQSPTYFEAVEPLEFFIPQTANQCTAANAGCDEFTNLDEVAAGGEGRGYFRYLRQCIKPTDTAAQCSNFYTWQGSNESGYQLRVYSLNANSDGSPKLAITLDSRWLIDWGNRQDCNGPEDIATNPFCKEFFGLDGKVHYEILANTISCAEDCHPFRKTRLGESDIDAQNNCTASNGTWQNSVCIYDAVPGEALTCSAAAAGCREYRGNAGGNLFYAFSDNFEDGETTNWQFGTISSEALAVGGHSLMSVSPLPQTPQKIETMRANLGKICSPDTVSECNSANANVNCYQPDLNRCVARHPVTGQTCLVEVGQQYCGLVGETLAANSAYLVSFWAKSRVGNVNIDVKLIDDQGTDYPAIGRVKLTPEWDYYTFGPIIYEEIKPSARLAFTAVDSTSDIEFYLDNIAIRKVQGYFYVIKNSWSTPASCDTNPFVSPAQLVPQFMLGCQPYRDLPGQIHNLKSFNHLCREEAVGCQEFIDTKNSSSPFRQEFLADDAVANVVVPPDDVIYIVDQPAFRCSADAKGCQRLGLPTISQDKIVTDYSDIYLINNPDEYQTSLCGNSEVGCEEYKTESGFSYFQDPGNRVCQYAANNNEPGWYKVNSQSLTPDCPVARSPLGTLHPSDGFVGVCPVESSTCTEFIDPVSEMATNLLFNSDLAQDVDKNYIPDGWNVSSSDTSANYLQQKTSFKRSTAYTLSFSNIDNGNPPSANDSNLFIGIVNCPGLTSFDNSMMPAESGVCVNSKEEVINNNSNPSDGSIFCSSDSDCNNSNTLDGAERCTTDNLVIPKTAYTGDWGSSGRPSLPDQRRFSGRFSTSGSLPLNHSCLAVMAETAENLGGIGRIKENLIKEISVREAGIYYQLASSVNRRDCNGVVDPNLGCILFNDRSQVNYKIDEADNSYLKFDADMSGGAINSNIPVANCAGGCDANAILKVRPDRQCGQWLDCRTKIKSFDASGSQRDFCLELAACDSLDEKGNCNNFVFSQRQLVNNFTLPDNNPLYNLTARIGEAKKLGNISGYAKAGITLTDFTQTDNTISGYYPYNLMAQVGEVALVPNGSFEDWSRDGYPIGWEGVNSNQSWDLADFQVVSNYSDTLAREGVAILGQGSLRLNTDKLVKSEFIDVNKNTDYVFSLAINTLNLQPPTAEAVAEVYGFDPNFDPNTEPAESVLATVTAPARLNWQAKSIKFNSGKFSQIRIKLSNKINDLTTTLEGSSYFDNVSLLPTLKIADQYWPTLGTWQPAYVSRSCRVFPQSTALSCEYTDGEGIQQRGWSGYCLELDPLKPGVCLQWWPIDLVRGDNFSQYTSFPEREPLYYCAKMATTPLSISAGTTGSQQPAGIQKPGTDQEESPWTSPNNELWVFSSNRQLGQPNYIDIKVASGAYNFTNLRLSPENNWEIGWIASGATAANKEYDDYTLYSDYCQVGNELSNPLPDGSQVQCEDNKGLNKLPDRLVEQKIGGGLGPNGDEILNGAHRAKIAATDPTYCIQGYPEGLEAGQKIIVYIKANFEADGTFINIEYGVCDTNTAKSNFEWEFRFSYAYCGELVQVVTPGGQNKAWLSRIAAGSTYKVPGLNYSYTQEYQPFGSVVPPLPSENPAEWDAKDDAQDNPDITSDDTFYLGNQPVFVEAPDTSFEWPYQARAGSPYSCDASGLADSAGCYLPDRTKVTGGAQGQPLEDVAAGRLKQLFAKSYNVWFWNGEGVIGGYNKKVCQSNTPLAGKECEDGDDCYPGVMHGCLYDDGFVTKSCATDDQCERCIGDCANDAVPPTCPAVEGGTCNPQGGRCRGGSESGSQANPGDCKIESPQYQKVDRADSNTQLSAKYSSLFWDVPSTLCNNNIRSQDPWCAVAPIITNISLNGQANDNTSIFGSDTVNLSFNPIVDSNQLPLTAYRVDWQDGRVTAVQGTPLRDKANERDPYILSHSYDYYDILEKNLSNEDIHCNTGNESLPADLANLPRHSCAIKPKIQVIDNWGWCNGSINPITRQKYELSDWGYQVNPSDLTHPETSCSNNSQAWTAFPWYIIIAPPQ